MLPAKKIHLCTLRCPWQGAACPILRIDIRMNWTYSQRKQSKVSNSFIYSFCEVHESII